MILLLTLSHAVGFPANADTTRWQAQLSFELQHHSRDRSDWRRLEATGGRRMGATTVLLAVARSTRFDQNEAVIAAEVYSKVGTTAVSGRVQVTPDATVLPGSDLSIELEHPVARGWTAAGAYRRMGFATGAVDIVGVAGTRYFARAFAQVRFSVIPQGGRTGVSARAAFRRYHGAAANGWIEGSVTVGREVVLLGTSQPVAVRSVWDVGIRVQHPFTPFWGLSMGLGWTGEEDLPSRVNASAGLLFRW